ncbi:MAG: FtsB family cell division protein [Eubacterium sp.]|jgi:cell division protein DivIC
MAKTKRKRRKKINYGRLFLTLIICSLLVVCFVTLGNIRELSRERSDLEAENEKLQAEKEQLVNELANVQDLDYIEEQARKQLNMVKPGEVLYVIDDDDSSSQDSSSDTGSDSDSGSDQNADSASGDSGSGSGDASDTSSDTSSEG